MTRAILVLAVLGVVGCGEVCPNSYDGRRIGEIAGASILVSPDDPPSEVGLLEEADAALRDALVYWGGDANALRGWDVIFHGSSLATCDGQRVQGCCDHCARTIVVMQGGECRSYFLRHEVGHVIIGDSNHQDPRWGGAYGSAACP